MSLLLKRQFAPNVWVQNAKSPVPVDVRRSKTFLLKLLNIFNVVMKGFEIGLSKLDYSRMRRGYLSIILPGCDAGAE